MFLAKTYTNLKMLAVFFTNLKMFLAKNRTNLKMWIKQQRLHAPFDVGMKPLC